MSETDDFHARLHHALTAPLDSPEVHRAVAEMDAVLGSSRQEGHTMTETLANGRYLLFAGAHYYPQGGWDDFKGTFETIEAAKAALGHVSESEWWQIVDRTTLKVVE